MKSCKRKEILLVAVPICTLAVSRRGRRRTQKNQQGAGLVEFALLAALILLVCIPAIRYFGDELGESFCHSARDIGESDGIGNYEWIDGECTTPALPD